MKNAYQAIAAQDLAPNTPNPKVTLSQCIIDNAYDAGIITINSSVSAVNCLISNCGKNLYLLKGGNYQFTHCTAASYSNNFILHQYPVATISNYIKINNIPQTASLTALFQNCIFWGEGGLIDDSDEVVVAISGANAPVVFNSDLLKVNTGPQNSTLNSTSMQLKNKDPLFDSINISKNYYDFHLQANSPGRDKGLNTSITIDLDGKSRPSGPPDLGCYEKQ